jgi:Na+-driven multidrug efflux pump
MKAYAIDCLLTAFKFCLIGFFNGCGKTTFVMAQGVFGAFAVRIPVSYFMSKLQPVSLFRVGLATPISSLIEIALCIVYFIVLNNQQKEHGHLEEVII